MVILARNELGTKILHEVVLTSKTLQHLIGIIDVHHHLMRRVRAIKIGNAKTYLVAKIGFNTTGAVPF